MKRKIIIILVLLMGFCTLVFAENMEDLQNRKNELKNQITETNEQIQEIQIELTENLEQLNNLNEKISGYENELKKLQSTLDNVEKEIETIEKKLKIVQQNYSMQRTALQNRIVSLYESGDILYLDVLLNSSSISDFISNYYLIGEIARYDNDLLENIENQKIQIEQTKEILAEKQKNIKTVKSNKEKTTVALENARIIQKSYIEKLTDAEKQTQDKIDEYQKELDIIEAKIVAIARADGNTEYIGRRI